MRLVYIVAMLVGASFKLWSQTSAKPAGPVSQPAINSRWDLNKFVWSHTHHDPELPGKPVIDFEAIDNWEGVGREVAISRDGKYFTYSTTRGTGLNMKQDSVVVASTAGQWRQAFTGTEPGFFSDDSRQYIYRDKGDLVFMKTGTGEQRRIQNITGHQRSMNAKNISEWLAITLDDAEKTVILENLITGKETRFKGVGSYSFACGEAWFCCQLEGPGKELLLYRLADGTERRIPGTIAYTFSPDGKILLISDLNNNLKYVNVAEGNETGIIWAGANNMVAGSYSFDRSGRQVVFVVEDSPPPSITFQAGHRSIWYWQKGMERAVQKVNGQSQGIGDGLLIGSSASFTDNGRYIRFSLQRQRDALKPGNDAVMVDVWSYKDKELQSTQAWEMTQPVSYTAVLDIANGRVLQLERAGEALRSAWIPGDYAIIAKPCCGDRFWEKEYARDSTWVVSLKDGSRRLLPVKTYGIESVIMFTPNGHWLVYFDGEKGCNYFSYGLQTGKLINISAGAPAFQFGYRNSSLRTGEKPTRPVGRPFVYNDRVIVFDNYDIWQLDITGKAKPVNLTNGYGKKHHTKLDLDLSIRIGDTLLLNAFNLDTKYNGYYRKILGQPGDPEQLYLGASFMECVLGIKGNGMAPIKAADVNSWVVRRETATESPNYFLTQDFKTYQQLTWMGPEKKYNWYTSELHYFKQMDGSTGQGVLYKPENFDSRKKYPVIISFYNQSSYQLHQYFAPEYNNCPLIFNSPAWIVSHGYLVFAPDIDFTRGFWGPSTLNTIDGAAIYLKKLPYADSAHLGMVGHSFSGRLGYYMLTHSHSFAAMSIGSGFTGTDVIGEALALYRNEKAESNLPLLEDGGADFGLGNMWKNKKVWLDHEAILQADHVTSPLLLFHNNQDADDVKLAVKLYTALRRLEKKCWWLQYDHGAHNVYGNPGKDFTIRYIQFFDHYLKGAPAPQWMTQGIPAKLKGIESRFELNAGGSCALQGKNHCYVCEAWNKQYKRNPAMFEKPISEWALDKDIKEELDRKTSEERKRLDKEGLVEQKRIVDVLKNGYPEDKKK